VIDVVCGGIVMYSRVIELTEDEINEYQENGNLDDLAYRISKGDSEIMKREITPESQNEQIEYVDML